jgi:hypothetical protein
MKKKRFFAAPSTFSVTPRAAREPIVSPIARKVTEHLSTLAERALSSKTIEDRVGLERAYAAPDSVYVLGSSIFVGGTQISRFGENFRDMFDDLKIPIPGGYGTRDSYRYAQVQKAIAAHPEATHIIGHSLGGAVALEAAKNYGLIATTYGAPVTDLRPKTLLEEAPMRFGNRGDPISMMDSKAQGGFVAGNPHGFGNFDHISSTQSQPGYANADGTVTLFE